MNSSQNGVRRSDGAATRKLILHHAEAMFATGGFSGVSLRQITAKAGVDLALIKYYFGSKEGLFNEVLGSRVDIMNKRRLDGMSTISVIPNDPETIKALLREFIWPMIGKTPSEIQDLRNYRMLIGLVTNSKTWQDEVFRQHYDPVLLRFIDILNEALPFAERKDIIWSLSFFLGSLVNAFAETGRVDRLSGGECCSGDLVEACRRLVDYTTGALMSISLSEQK